MLPGLLGLALAVLGGPDAVPVRLRAEGGLEVDLSTRKAVARGRVVIERGALAVCCDRAEIDYAESGTALERVSCTGRVVVHQPDVVHARAVRAEVDLVKGWLILSGDPVVTAGASRLTGPRVRFDLRRERVLVDGGTTRLSWDPEARPTPVSPCPG